MEPSRTPLEDEPIEDPIEVELAWAEEIERRCAELDAGEAETDDLADVLHELDRAAAYR